jgi:hypothetical protein
MVTFTLPCEFRAMAYRHQKIVYSILFSCVAGILKDFGLNPRHLGAEIGMTMVLHTHNRRLDFHPHIHVVLPIMQHVLPKGFRRVRDYGFLHSNVKLLFLVQLILHVKLKKIELRPRPFFKCPCCKSPMYIVGFRSAGWEPG